tara:strand:- start:4394 stop:6400 length:2007 start_codon:yes stop_codon:yes gene_type:complete
MNNLTKSDLIKIAKNYNIHVLIPKYYTLRKDDLINKMNQHLIFDYANKKIIRKEHSPINVVVKEKKKRAIVGSGYLDNFNLKELRRVCRIYNVHNKITRFTKLTKEELIEEMKKHFTFENNKINIKKQDIKEEDKPTTRSLKAAEEKKKKEEEEKKRKEDEEKEKIKKKKEEELRLRREELEREEEEENERERKEQEKEEKKEARKRKKQAEWKAKHGEEHRRILKEREDELNRIEQEKEDKERIKAEKQKKYLDKKILKENEEARKRGIEAQKERKKIEEEREKASKRIKDEEDKRLKERIEEQAKKRQADIDRSIETEKRKKKEAIEKGVIEDSLLPKPLFNSIEKGFNWIKDLQKKGLEKGQIEYEASSAVQFIISALFLEKYQTCPIATINMTPGYGWSEEKFLKSLKNCLEYNYKTICIPATVGEHQNLLIIKVDTREIIRFEPHGAYLRSQSMENDAKINDFFEKLVNKINEYLDLLKSGKRKFKYYDPSNICPKLNNSLRKEGFQYMENIDRRESSTLEGTGFCQLWSMFFMECILRNPDMDIKDIYKSAYTLMNDDPKYFKDVIRGYFIDIDDELKKINNFYYKSINRADMITQKGVFEYAKFYNEYIKLLGKRKLELSKTKTKIEFTGEGKFRRPLLNKKIVGSGAFNKPLLNKKLSKY